MKLNETILEVMRHICNYFHFDRSKNREYCRTEGFFKDGHVALEGDFTEGDWIAVTGSRGFDGIYILKESTLPLESTIALLPYVAFTLSDGTDDKIHQSIAGEATVYLLLPRAGFISLCLEIKEYMDNPDNFPNSKIGENVIGFYSYSKATGENGRPLTVFQVFSERLKPFRQMFSTLEV